MAGCVYGLSTVMHRTNRPEYMIIGLIYVGLVSCWLHVLLALCTDNFMFVSLVSVALVSFGLMSVSLVSVALGSVTLLS